MIESNASGIIYEPVHKRLELADLLEQYLVDEWTNDEMQDKLCELKDDARNAPNSLYWQLHMYFDDFKTRKHSRVPTRCRDEEAEFLRRVILFLRSPLPYPVKLAEPIASPRVLYLFGGGLLFFALVSWRLTLLVVGWVVLVWLLVTEILIPVYKRLAGVEEPDESAYWPFLDVAQYRAALEAADVREALG